MNEAKVYFVGVNYGTADLIESWASSIYRVSGMFQRELYVVDNFKSTSERKKAEAICCRLGVILIENKNSGYGAALNKAIATISTSETLQNYRIICGNLDVVFKGEIQSEFFDKLEQIEVLHNNSRVNRYITKLQRRFFWLLWPAALTQSNKLYFSAIAVLKIIKQIPSASFSVHGSVFVLSSDILTEGVFDDKSFLYWEEVVFGDFLASKNIEISYCSTLTAKHSAQATTKEIVEVRKTYLQHWAHSYLNWYKS